MRGQVLEERRAVAALERRAALAHRVEQAGHARVVDLAASAQETGHRRQALAQRREREAAVLLLDDVLEREAAQDAGERARVGVHGRGELRAGQRAIGERLGDPQLGHDEQQLRHDVAIH